MKRRTLLGAAAAASLAIAPGLGSAQTRPQGRILVGSAAGGLSDLFARTLAEALTKRTGQSFVVENRTGGGGIIAAQALTAAPPDGNTLLLMTLGHVMVPHLQRKAPYDALADFAPITSLAKGASLVVIHQSVPAQDLAGFIAYAKANPGKLTYGSAGIGSPQHLSTEHLKASLGIDMVHVPYRGTAPATIALRGGEISMQILDLANAEPLLKEGRARAIAQTGLANVPGYERLPRIADLAPGFDVGFWMGVVAPKGTPEPVLEALNRQIAAIATSDLKERASAAGLQAFTGSRAEFARFLANENAIWSDIINKRGIKQD